MPPAAGPTAVMRAEHREIEALIGKIETGIADRAAPVEELRRSLHDVLGEHNFKEEQILYPTTDQFLGPDKADQLVERIQRFRFHDLRHAFLTRLASKGLGAFLIQKAAGHANVRTSQRYVHDLTPEALELIREALQGKSSRNRPA